jgi:hypothetical protein
MRKPGERVVVPLAQRCYSGIEIVKDGDDLVDPAGLQYLFHHWDRTEQCNFASTAAHCLRRNDD